MKYWNRKGPERNNWTKIAVANNDYNKEQFIWCKQQASIGRFYRYYGNNHWWFENKEDAVMFILRFGNGN